MKKQKSKSGEPSVRLLRVGENVRHALSAVLARGEVMDDDLKGKSITVTEVRVSPDLRHANIFVMPLGGDADGKVVKALNRHSHYLRGQISHALVMKYMPELRFMIDESFDEAGHIDAILRDPRVARDLRHDDEDQKEGEE